MIDIEIVDCIALDEGDATIGLGWTLDFNTDAMEFRKYASIH